MINDILFRSISSDKITLFNKLFCLSVFLKSSLEIYRGYWSYFNNGSYLNFLTAAGSNINPFKIYTYKLSIFIKLLAPVLFFFSILPFYSMLFLTCALGFELKIYFKYHTNLMFLYSCILSIFYFSSINSNVTIVLFPLSIALTLSSSYIFTAIHKMNSSFLSGNVILRTVELINQSDRTYFDYGNITETSYFVFFKTNIKYFMFATIAIELLLPFLLFSDQFKLLGCFLGFCLHLGFTLMFPATLLHFSLLSFSTYLLFFYF